MSRINIPHVGNNTNVQFSRQNRLINKKYYDSINHQYVEYEDVFGPRIHFTKLIASFIPHGNMYSFDDHRVTESNLHLFPPKLQQKMKFLHKNLKIGHSKDKFKDIISLHD